MNGIFLEKNRERILARYEELKKALPARMAEVDKKISEWEENTALACKYMYITMPYSDIANYEPEVFKDYGENAVWLWENREDVKELPEEIFLNYVLYCRVNEEEIAPCRTFFREQMGERVLSLHGKAAALEVNYWCAEEATYHCTDERTLSAITVYRRGNGRCGEESVFTVNAMRSVGIPARQVYAPRWSHCDDNHAWVEVWCEGDWYFLGACEPLPILNKGWFTNASSRAMMVHSRCFDTTGFDEENIDREGMVAVFNELKRYAAVKKIQVQVVDGEKNPVSGAKVYFEVLNYSEFSPVAEAKTDENGSVSLTTGLGSLHIMAVYGDKCAETYMDTRNSDTCVVSFAETEVRETWQEMDMIAPVDTPVNTDTPTEEQTRIGNIRLDEAAAKRLKKTENWENPEKAVFLGKEDHKELRKEMLAALTEKDQTDFVSSVLEEHLALALPYENTTDHETFVKYILNPRVRNEILKPYRKEIQEAFTEEEKDLFVKEPKKLWEAVDRRFSSCADKERSSIITTPAGCLRTGIASPLSKKIFFVAAARTLGIPARLNPRDDAMEYMENGSFVAVLPESEKNCRLVLKGGEGTVWKYFLNWSIARFVDGRFVSLQLEDAKWEDGKLALGLDAGQYRILTSNRLPNGNIFANRYYVDIAVGEEKEAELVLRHADLEDMLENIDIPDFELCKNEPSEDVEKVKASVLTEKGKHIFMFLEESREPTEHILNEMIEQKEAFEKLGDTVIFVVRTEVALKDPNIARALRTFPEIQVYYDSFRTLIETLGRRMYVDHEKLPLIIVTDGKLNGIYATSGYNVGTGDMLLRLM